MKTFTKLNLGVAALLTAGAISPLSVFADDVAEGTTSLQGNTTITFEAPKTGLLTLNQVPDFDFKNHDLTSNKNSTYSATGDKSIRVMDLTGSNDGYHVTANASQLLNGSSILPVASFAFTTADGTKNAATQGQILGTGATAASIYQGNAKVATGNANANGTNDSGQTSAVLTLNDNTIKAGQYKGTIDYTLSPSMD